MADLYLQPWMVDLGCSGREGAHGAAAYIEAFVARKESGHA